jgi:hypothetical protein
MCSGAYPVLERNDENENTASGSDAQQIFASF